jgi:hypothetical protein
MLSQTGCNVTGTWDSSINCRSKCTNIPDSISGIVSGNTFSFTTQSASVNCITCYISCYTTYTGTLIINGARMYGTNTGNHCDGSSFFYTHDLARSTQNNISPPNLLIQYGAKCDGGLDPLTESCQ